MAKQVLIMTWCVFTLGLFHSTDSALVVSPNEVIQGLSPSFEINCTFSLSDQKSASNITHLISLLVSKSKGGSNARATEFHDLVSVNRFAKEVTIITPVNASASGHISANCTSYLSIRWAYPGMEVGGLYGCRIIGMDKLGRTVEELEIKPVTSTKPNMRSLVEVVKLQQIRMRKMRKILDTLSNTVANNHKKVNHAPQSGLGGSNKGKDTLMKPWRYVQSLPYKDSHYELSTGELVNDGKAEAVCQFRGGHLAQIDDSYEHSFIRDFLKSSAPQEKSYVLVGGRHDWPGTWIFHHSPQVVQYTNGSPGRPTRARNNCIFLNKMSDWSMSDYNCSSGGQSAAFLCEIHA